jgi:hypothetical protein
VAVSSSLTEVQGTLYEVINVPVNLGQESLGTARSAKT